MIRKQKTMTILALATTGLGVFSACDSFKEKVTLTGKRETILSIDSSLIPDSAVSGTPVSIPSSTRNRDWAQAGGIPSHALTNSSLATSLNQTWASSVGYGSSEDHRLTSGPVVADGHVYASDAMGMITALNVKDGTTLWSVNSLPEGHSAEAMGGGVAYDNGKVYCTTSFGELLSLRATDGKELWRKPIGAPSRVAPTVKDGKVYVLTINNETRAFSADAGVLLWDHAGISEAAGILGGASPAVSDGIVVSAYSSGEVFGFDAGSGQPIWGDLLNPALRIDSVASIAHIRARPVISGGIVYVISHGGQMVALDLKTGTRLWQREIGGIRSPAVVGGFIFSVTNSGDLVCIVKGTGQIRWAVPLPKVDSNKRPILWAGPIVAGGGLILAGTNGQVLFVSTKDGKTTKTIESGSEISQSPIVADGSLYIMTDDANIIRYSREEAKS